MVKHYLLLLLFCLIQSNIFATDVIVSDINYRLNEENKTAEVISKGNEEYSGDIVIPSYIEYNNESYRVYSIGYSSFSGAKAIKSVILEKGIVEIKSGAFWGCENLEKVSLPKSLSAIRGGAFQGCTNLKDIYIENLSTFSNHWCGDVERLEHCHLFDNAQNIYVNGVKVSSLDIPEGTTSINNYVFAGLKCLDTITIPSTLDYICVSAFENTNFKTVKISNLENYCKIDHNTEDWFNCYLFNNANEVIIEGKRNKDIVIPSTIKRIGNSAFSGLKCNVNIIIPESVTSIGKYAFYNCANVDSLYVLCKNITYEEGYDFYKSNIKRFFVQEGSNAYQEHTKAIKEELKSAGSCGVTAYYTLTNEGKMNVWGTGDIQSYDSSTGTNWRPWLYDDVKTLKINEGITFIGNNAFAWLSELTDVTIDGNIGVGYAGFRECGKLENLYIKGKITGVNTYGFMNCYNLRDIDLSECDYIGMNGFCGCTSLDKIVLSPGLSKIYPYSFAGCRNIQEIIVPDNVKEIGESAFASCYSLQSLTIGKNVNRIEKGIVWRCDNLKAIYMKGYNYQSGQYRPFEDFYRTSTLYLPKGGRSVGVWEADWNTYQKFTNIKENHFYDDEPTSIDITISSAKWSTMILPFDTEIPNGLTVYSCNSSNDNVLTLDEVTSIKANTPYIVNGEQGTYQFSAIGSAWEDTYDGGWFTGTYIETNVPENSYILAKVNGVVGFYRVSEANVGNTKIAPYHCFLTPNYESQAKCNAFFFDDIPTAIINVDYKDNISEPNRYNLNGQRVRSNAKGIIIENGKKYIIK